jgi:hypothetical protein
MAAEYITLTAEQNVTEARCTAASTTGLGFRDMQTNKVRCRRCPVLKPLACS